MASVLDLHVVWYWPWILATCPYLLVHVFLYIHYSCGAHWLDPCCLLHCTEQHLEQHRLERARRRPRSEGLAHDRRSRNPQLNEPESFHRLLFHRYSSCPLGVSEFKNRSQPLDEKCLAIVRILFVHKQYISPFVVFLHKYVRGTHAGGAYHNRQKRQV